MTCISSKYKARMLQTVGQMPDAEDQLFVYANPSRAANMQGYCAWPTSCVAGHHGSIILLTLKDLQAD